MFGKTAGKFAEAAADLQDVLGEHQDAVVAGAWLREARTGSMRSWQERWPGSRRRPREARDEWPEAWKALSRKKRLDVSDLVRAAGGIVFRSDANGREWRSCTAPATTTGPSRRAS